MVESQQFPQGYQVESLNLLQPTTAHDDNCMSHSVSIYPSANAREEHLSGPPEKPINFRGWTGGRGTPRVDTQISGYPAGWHFKFKTEKKAGNLHLLARDEGQRKK